MSILVTMFTNLSDFQEFRPNFDKDVCTKRFLQYLVVKTSQWQFDKKKKKKKN